MRGTGVPPRLIPRAVPIDGSQPVAVALAGDRVLVLWADGATIRLHENAEGAEPRVAEFKVAAQVHALALSPSGVLAVAACADGKLRVLNTGYGGSLVLPMAAAEDTARAVAVASEHGPVVAAFADGSIRRFDLTAGRWDMVGSGSDIAIVAVSPGGGLVVAFSTRGYLCGWTLPDAIPAGFRELETAASAIAADGTGGTVLAGRSDGTLWLYDLADGLPVEFGMTKAPPLIRHGQWWERPEAGPFPPAPVAPGNYAPPPSPGSPASRAPAARLVDDDVRFTV
jgi:WD40 repeat protein